MPDADHPSETLGPRYRLVFEVSRPVKPFELEPLGLYLAALLGLSECLDHGCLESSRLFYLPRCPAALHGLAQSETIEGQPLDVDALLAQKRFADIPPVRKAAGTGTTSVIDAFNRQADIAQILERNNYERRGRKRWMYPDSGTGLAGVVQCPDSDRIFSHHPNDPLYVEEHSHDAFSVYCILEHGGDYRSAVKAAAVDMGMGNTRQPDEKLKRVDLSGIVGRVNPDTGEIEAPPTPQPIDETTLSEELQKLRSAITAIPEDAMLKKHPAERIIGMALRHNTANIDESIGRSLCFEWDTLTGGSALSIFERSDPNYPGQPLGLASVFALTKDNGWKDSGIYAWPAPTPLPDALPPVMAFDAQLLPLALRGWVMDIAHRMQCPADFPAVAALVALSSLIGARAVIQPKACDDWQVVPNLWGMAIGRPGVKKSPALNEALKPLSRLQADEFELHKAAHEEWELDCKVAAMQDDANEKKAKGLANKDPAAARALLEPVVLPAEPTARRFIVNDATVEKLGELMQQNPWGTLSYRDELYGLLTSLDKQGQEGSRAFYLQSYDGNQGYTFDRIMRGTVHIPRVCLAMIGGIQPGRIQEYVRGAVAGGSADDGLLQRFGLAVWPDTTREFVNVDQWPDTPAKQTAWAVFERLAALQPASETDPHVWRFSPEAQAVFVEWLVPFETEIRGDDLHPAMVSHLAKYLKLILALVFALIDTPDTGGIVHEGELLRALAWCDYLRTHASRLYAAAVMPETTGAAALLVKIKAGLVKDGFKIKDVKQKGWSGLATTDEARKAVAILEDYDWLRCDVVPPGAAGGRPSETLRVNPYLNRGEK